MVRWNPPAKIESKASFENLTYRCQFNVLMVPVRQVVLEEDSELRLFEFWPHVVRSDPPANQAHKI